MNNTTRTLRVTGKGQIRVKPDCTRITLTLESVCPDYDEALRRSSRDTEHLKNILMPFGFGRSDLKTLDFSVDTEYESYKEEGAYRQRLIGYRYSHRMKVEFPSDNDRLGQVLYALAGSPLHPEFRISYTVSDPESAKNELLGNAVWDAMQKASVLSKAAGVSLRDIQNIDYSWGEIDFEVRPMERMMLTDSCIQPGAGSYDLDIEPDDITVSDTVTVVWEIS